MADSREFEFEGAATPSEAADALNRIAEGIRARSLSLSMGAARAWNLDMTRAARETLPDYGQRSYYEVWFGALLKQLEERGLVAADEVAAGRSLYPALALPRVLRARDVPTVQARGAPTERLAIPGRAGRMTRSLRLRVTIKLTNSLKTTTRCNDMARPTRNSGAKMPDAMLRHVASWGDRGPHKAIKESRVPAVKVEGRTARKRRQGK